MHADELNSSEEGKRLEDRFNHLLVNRADDHIDENSDPVNLAGLKPEVSPHINNIKDTQAHYEEERSTINAALLSAGVRIAHLGCWEWDMTQNRFFPSEEFREIHGFSTADLSMDELLKIAHPEDLPSIRQAFNDAATLGTAYELEHRIIRQDTGEIRLVKAYGEPTFDQAGNPQKLYGTTQDITELRRIESALRMSEGKYRELYASMMDGFARVDMMGHLIEFNPAFRAMVGYSDEELHTLTYQALTPEKWHTLEATIIREQILQRGYSDVYEKEYKRKDGSVFPVELRAVLQTDEAGEPESIWAIVRDISERKQAEQALHESEERFRLMADVAPIPLVMTRLRDNKILYVNAQFAGLFGLSRDEMVSRLATEFYVDPRRRMEIIKAVKLVGSVMNTEVHLRKADRSTFWGLLSYVLTQLENEPVIIVGLMDVTERKQYELAFREREEWFRSLTKLTPAGIFRTDVNGNTIYCNDKLFQITGMNLTEAIDKGLENAIHPEDRQVVSEEWQAFMQNQQPFNLQCRLVRKDGTLVWTIWEAEAIQDLAGMVIGYVGAITDISELKQAEEQLRVAANHDLLTHLPNRRLLNDRLQQEVAKSSWDGYLLAVCYIDLDGFKEINDQLGHDTGDKVLIEVANRLVASVRGGDTVARLGGDEFVILLSNLTGEEECQIVLERLVSNIASPYPVDGNHTVAISASIGITLYPGDDVEPEILLRHADHAMYAAKQGGKNRFHYFDKNLDQRVEAKQEMLRRIEKGLATGQMELYYQPKVDFQLGQVTGAEALIRWQHPSLGLVEPAKFLPCVEDHDLAIAVGYWVVGEALRQMELWLAEGLNLQISINVFARELHDREFADRLKRVLAEHQQIPPERLRIEILETAALPDLEIVQQVIADCQALGVSFSLDDFGTGYSSLHYLRNLAVAELKIDQSFVRDMLFDTEALAIVEGIIGLSRAFQRSIVAEGVETPEHIAKLLALGCHQMQGYVISRPLPAGQLLPWVRDFQPNQLLNQCPPALN